MRKLKEGKKFGRTRDQRNALIKNLSAQFFLKEKIKTSEAKAKELRGFVEKIITKAKKGGLSNVRLLARYYSKDLVKKIVNEIGPRYKDRAGGYTRIIKLGPRKSDGAKITMIELLK